MLLISPVANAKGGLDLGQGWGVTQGSTSGDRRRQEGWRNLLPMHTQARFLGSRPFGQAGCCGLPQFPLCGGWLEGLDCRRVTWEQGSRGAWAQGRWDSWGQAGQDPALDGLPPGLSVSLLVPSPSPWSLNWNQSRLIVSIYSPCFHPQHPALLPG